MEKIKSIKEAFSNESVTLRVIHGTTSIYEISEIKEEKHLIDGKQCSFYVGYNINRQKLFFYHKAACNAHYEVEDELPF